MSERSHAPLAASPLSRPEADALARLFHSLADRSRVMIVNALLHAPDGELHGGGHDLRLAVGAR